MYLRLFICTLFCFFAASNAWSQQEMRLAFYNVENLFHPSDDSLSDDEEFTPGGERQWNKYRYREKLNRTAKAILAIGNWEAPAAIGLMEIENDSVLIDLVNSPTLRKFNYQWVSYPSADRRGIEVALLYRRDRFKLLQSGKIKASDSAADYSTRDILYVQLYAPLSDTLHIYVNHWPSRYGGQQRSEPRRMAAASALRTHIDSLRRQRPGATLIIGGDFNDEWFNPSLNDLLLAGHDSNLRLYNLMAQLPANEGSHRYRGQWAYLDQIIVSANLLDGIGVEVKDGRAGLIKHAFLLEEDNKYPGQKPFRSFLGPRYHGGFSDHLPVYIDLLKKQ